MFYEVTHVCDVNNDKYNITLDRVDLGDPEPYQIMVLEEGSERWMYAGHTSREYVKLNFTKVESVK